MLTPYIPTQPNIKGGIKYQFTLKLRTIYVRIR